MLIANSKLTVPSYQRRTEDALMNLIEDSTKRNERTARISHILNGSWALSLQFTDQGRVESSCLDWIFKEICGAYHETFDESDFPCDLGDALNQRTGVSDLPSRSMASIAHAF